MVECRHCREVFQGSREDLGARCPSCRLPIFESRETPALAKEGSARTCGVHAGNAAIGTCKRCRQGVCRVCRTFWHDQVFCPGCVEKSLSTLEPAPDQLKQMTRMSLIGLVLGLSGWLLLLAAVFMAIQFAAGPIMNREGNLGGLVFLLSMVPTLFGVALGATAARIRGKHLPLAVLGMTVSGLHLGAVLGLISFFAVSG